MLHKGVLAAPMTAQETGGQHDDATEQLENRFHGNVDYPQR